MKKQNKVIEVALTDAVVADKALAKATALEVKLSDVKISNQTEYDYYAGKLQQVKVDWREVDNDMRNITRPFDKIKEVVRGMFKKPLGIYKAIEESIKKCMVVYQNEQDKIQEKEEEEFQKKLKEDEAEKKELEKKAEGEDDIFKSEALKEKIEKIEDEPAPVVFKVAKPQGVSFTEKWSAVIVDEDKIPRGYLIPDLVALNLIARTEKGRHKVPGVKFVCEKIVVSRG